MFYVSDTEVTGSMVPEEVNVYLWRAGFHLFFPMRSQDHWRIVGILPADLRERNGVQFDDVIPSLRGEAGAGLSIKACSWFSTYRISHRAASRFRDRRCFLLGDAAHIHSPVGAQGMNTGLQDAYNLGWKLAMVVNGEAGAALLDSYEEERIPIARRLLETTDRAFKLVVSDNPLAGLLRTQIIARFAALLTGYEKFQRFAFRTVSQTGIHYRSSRLSQSLPGLPGGAPRAGDRFPWLKLKFDANGPIEDVFQKLDDTKLHLIVIGQAAPSERLLDESNMLRVHAVPADPGNDAELARAQIPRPSFYIVRPDGHIGLCGASLEPSAIARYASERLRLGIGIAANLSPRRRIRLPECG